MGSRQVSVGVKRHDLHRMFITIAEGLDICPYTIKRLVGHAVGCDVTSGYIISKWILNALERIEQGMMSFCMPTYKQLNKIYKKHKQGLIKRPLIYNYDQYN
ncbi:hypothetical protein GCM10027040_13170 [Halomonas shantousis]